MCYRLKVYYWEQRKLEALASFSKGNGYTKKDLVNSGKPIILYGRLYTNYEVIISNVDTFVSEVARSAVVSSGNEVIVPASGESSEDIARASVVGKSDIILGGDLNIIKPVNFQIKLKNKIGKIKSKTKGTATCKGSDTIIAASWIQKIRKNE